MPHKISNNPADYIGPLYMNGLHGRMLRIPGPPRKKREILLIYGHHSSLERLFGLAQDISRYGTVTMPDLPGFGGMESFYKLGEKPSLDNLADYLAAFVKLNYKRRRVSIMGMSMGFLVATRMLQRYPELAKKVDILISVVGFVHRDDFKFRQHNYLLMRYGSSFFSNFLPAWFAKTFVLRAPLIRLAYRSVADRHSKMRDADKIELKRRIDFEVVLWKCNDIRTYMDTTVSMLTADLCKERVDIPVYHIAVPGDRYFDNKIVEQHLNVIYSKVEVIVSKVSAHAPTIIATAEDIEPFVPPKIRRMLARA